MQTYSIARYQLRGMLAGLERLGLDRAALLREAEIDPAELDDADARFSELAMLRLWLSAERRYAGELLSLRAAAAVPFGELELMDYLIGTGDTVADVFTRLARFARLCASGVHYTFEQSEDDGDVLVVLCHPRGVGSFPPALIEYVWTLLIARARAVLGDRFRTTLRLPHAARAPLAEYVRFLGRVEFDKPRPELLVPRDVWQLANPRADLRLGGMLEHYAVHALRSLLDVDDPLEHARRELSSVLGEGEPSIQHVARKLGLTPRTLQRRLADSGGYTFRKLVDEVREQAGRSYIERTQLSLIEITYLLGYSDPSAFSRAFRRWTGTTPAEHRLRARSLPTAPKAQSEGRAR
jgi:AraC-like DNA-binding protein